MFLRATFSVSLLTFLFAVPAHAQFNTPLGAIGAGRLTGTVYDASGATSPAAHIDVRDASTGIIVASGFAHDGGSFELYNIPEGNYQVVAEANGQQGQELVSVHGSLNNVEIHLRGTTQATGHGGTVSAAQLLVPPKAREAYTKAQQAFVKNKPDQATKYLDKAIEIYPHFAEALTLQALLALEKDDVSAAQDNLEHAIQYDPNYGMAYTALGSIYNSQGRYDDAMRATDRGMALSPNAWQPYFEASKAYFGKRMYERCLQMADKAQSLGGNAYVAIHMLKAYALIPQKLYRQARQEVQAFLSTNPKGDGAAQAQQLLAKLQQVEEAEVPPPPPNTSKSLR